MKICSEYLHCTHEHFLNLSTDERYKWYAFEEMVRRRENYFKEQEIKAIREQQAKMKIGK